MNVSLIASDSLSRQTQVQSYATYGGTRYARGQAKFDDRSRIYQTLKYAVNPATGRVGNALIGNSWHDPSGNEIQAIAPGDGQVFTKNVFNGVNWLTSSYRGYNTTGTSYAQAGTVAGDIIVEQLDNTFDEAGNTITMPQVTDPTQSFAAVYDAWNRMVSISAGSTSIGKYQYDGRGFRIVKQTYTSGTLSETRHFYYTSGWQDIEEQVSGTMVDQYVWPALSMVEGGSQYIDQFICRDDATPRRLYACQDANFNLTSITNTSGAVVERYLFDPYGTRTIMNASWTVISSSAYNWAIGFQGLMLDKESGLAYGRGRYAHLGIGLWARREPSGPAYIDGANLYAYETGNPCSVTDPFGSYARRWPRPHLDFRRKGKSTREQYLMSTCTCSSPANFNLPVEPCAQESDVGQPTVAVQSDGVCGDYYDPNDTTCTLAKCTIIVFFECERKEDGIGWVWTSVDDSCMPVAKACNDQPPSLA